MLCHRGLHLRVLEQALNLMVVEMCLECSNACGAPHASHRHVCAVLCNIRCTQLAVQQMLHMPGLHRHVTVLLKPVAVLLHLSAQTPDNYHVLGQRHLRGQHGHSSLLLKFCCHVWVS